MAESESAGPNTEPQDEASDAPATDQATDQEEIRDYRGTGIVWGGLLVVLLAVGLIVVAFQNSHDVEFDFLWINTTAPLVLIIAIAIAAAIVIDEVVGFVWRRRRRSRLRDRDELKRLRARQ